MLLGFLVVHDELGWLVVVVEEDVVLCLVGEGHADGALDDGLLLVVVEGQDAVLVEPAHADVDELLACEVLVKVSCLRRLAHRPEDEGQCQIPLEVHVVLLLQVGWLAGFEHVRQFMQDGNVVAPFQLAGDITEHVHRQLVLRRGDD